MKTVHRSIRMKMKKKWREVSNIYFVHLMNIWSFIKQRIPFLNNGNDLMKRILSSDQISWYSFFQISIRNLCRNWIIIDFHSNWLTWEKLRAVCDELLSWLSNCISSIECHFKSNISILIHWNKWLNAQSFTKRFFWIFIEINENISFQFRIIDKIQCKWNILHFCDFVWLKKERHWINVRDFDHWTNFLLILFNNL